MIELQIKAPLSNVLDFIDNRLIPKLDENKLGKLVKSNFILKRINNYELVSNIDDKIMFVERSSKQVSFFMFATIVTLAYRSFSNRPNFTGYGVKLLDDGASGTRMIIEDLRYAGKRGILPKNDSPYKSGALKKVFKIIFKIIVAILILLSAIFTLGLSLLVFLLIYIVARYKNWRMHQFVSETMESIIEIFSWEFNKEAAFPNRKPPSRLRRIGRAILDEIFEMIDPTTVQPD